MVAKWILWTLFFKANHWLLKHTLCEWGWYLVNSLDTCRCTICCISTQLWGKVLKHSRVLWTLIYCMTYKGCITDRKTSWRQSRGPVVSCEFDSPGYGAIMHYDAHGNSIMILHHSPVPECTGISPACQKCPFYLKERENSDEHIHIDWLEPNDLTAAAHLSPNVADILCLIKASIFGLHFSASVIIAL